MKPPAEVSRVIAWPLGKPSSGYHCWHVVADGEAHQLDIIVSQSKARYILTCDGRTVAQEPCPRVLEGALELGPSHCIARHALSARYPSAKIATLLEEPNDAATI